MVVKVDKWGNRYHEPPYTKAEEEDFYRRTGGGPVTVARPIGDRKAPKPPKQQQPSPANVRGKGRHMNRRGQRREGKL
jgi:hypothetical protein